MIYGIILYWITTSVLILIGHKHPSRDLDSYGGLFFVFFATFAFGWLIVIFPFNAIYFADALPETLRFSIQGVTKEIALAALIVLFIVHLVLAVYSLILRLYVREARKNS